MQDGKLAALGDDVSNITGHDASPSGADASRDERADDSASYAALRAHVAARLAAEADDLADRWIVQARSVALRDPVTDAAGEEVSGDIAPLIAVLVEACRSERTTSDDGVALGLAYGSDAFERHLSLHHMLKGLDLLSAMTLYVVERAAEDMPGIGHATPSAADGVRLCRHLQQVSGMLTFAAAKGYTHAVSDGLRDRFRHLRHDLRNPLGTIKSVLSMMDDESMPADERSSPRFRAMAKRNARSLDELIVARLSDAAAMLPTLAHQSVSLRAIACAVRRNLRAEAEARDVTISVASVRSRVRVDSVGLELLLHAALLSVLQEASSGEELSITFGDVQGARGPRALISLDAQSGRVPVADVAARERLSALVKQMGGTLDVADSHLVLSVPIQAGESGTPPHAVPVAAPITSPTDLPSVQRKPRDDIRGEGQRDDGQPGAF